MPLLNAAITLSSPPQAEQSPLRVGFYTLNQKSCCIRSESTGRVVDVFFAILLAEDLFATRCKPLVSLTSAPQITPVGSLHTFTSRSRTSYRYARPSAFAEADPNPQSRRSVHRLPPQGPWTRCPWLDPGANESKPPSGGFFGRANRQDDTARSDLFNGAAKHGPAATASTIAMATPGRCQLRRRTCKVTSGGQLRRTGRMLVPAPTEV